ncbi:MAG: dockerin, partial [Clostridiales bacterium]|nr:dockerin [Clostridiales bacterium]
IRGDVDCDGDIDFDDVGLMYGYFINEVTLTAQGVANADFNGDGVVNTADVSGLYRYILGM